MQYKTIVLEMLKQNQPLHDELRANRTLLATVDRAAAELKSRHNDYMKQMAARHPEMEANAAYSAAFEMALKELEDRLLTASQADDQELSLDQAMASVTSPSRRG